MNLFSAQVKSRREIGPGIFAVRFSGCEQFRRRFVPGQFVMVGIPEAASFDPLLKRPFSVARVFAPENEFELAVKVVGRGTAILQNLRPGDQVPVQGPLGNGYPLAILRPAAGKVIMVAGGLGVASLVSLLDHCRQTGWTLDDITFILGGRTREELVYREMLVSLQAEGLRFLAVTEDGSYGCRGLVTDPLAARLDAEAAAGTLLFSCGPLPMLQAVCRLAAGSGATAYLSLESRMACGFGVCLGCVTRKRKPGAGDSPWLKVCVDGPVFPAEMLSW